MIEPFVGCIQYFAFEESGWKNDPHSIIRRSYMQCKGQSLAINQYQALYGLLKTVYGGDGRTSFNLPDYQGRMIMGADPGRLPQGRKGGAEMVTITKESLPTHTHTVPDIKLMASTKTGTLSTPKGNVPAVSSTNEDLYSGEKGNDHLLAMAADITTDAKGAAFPVMPPFLALTCVIAVTGLFPSRY